MDNLQPGPTIAKRIVRLAFESYPVLLHRLTDRDRTNPQKGMYLRVATVSPISGAYQEVLAIALGMELNPKDQQDYNRSSLEKHQRLARNHGHVSSWFSRNEVEHQYGGAIRCDDPSRTIISISGLPEAVDEQYALYLATRIKLITAERANEICARSGNQMDAIQKLFET